MSTNFSIILKNKMFTFLFLSLAFTCLLVFLHPFTAHADQPFQTNVGWIPQDQLANMANFDQTNCYNTTYAQSEWPWMYEGSTTTDGTAASPYQATAGQTITLNIFEETFLCYWATNPGSSPWQNKFSGNPGAPGDSTVDAAPFGLSNEPIPASDWPGQGGQLLSNQSKFQFGTPTFNGVPAGGVSNNLLITNFGHSSRYWEPTFGNPSFQYTAPTSPGLHTITVDLPVYGANQFLYENCPGPWDSGGFCGTGDGPPGVGDACIGYNRFGVGGGAMDSNNYDNSNLMFDCQPQHHTFTLFVNVTSPFNNVATLKAITPAGNVNRCQSIDLNPGMYNTGPSNGPFGTAVELYPSSSPSDVSNTSCGGAAAAIPNGGDVNLLGDGYNNGNMTNGQGNPFHYFWVRSKDPPLFQAYSAVNYQPTHFYVSNSAMPADKICFTNTVTPQNSGGGYSSATIPCYSVFVQLTCGSMNITSDEINQPLTVTLPFNPLIPTPAEGQAYVTVDGVSHPATYDPVNKQWTYTIPALTAYGTHSIGWSFTANKGSGVGGVSCGPQNFLVVAFPYIRAFGGDVFAGGDSTDVVSCFKYMAGIYSYNNGAANNDIGAGTNLAALATGNIDRFVSGQNLLGTSTNKLNPLTFANSSGSYGGSYGTTSCGGTDYYSTIDTLPNSGSSGGPSYQGVCPANIIGMTLNPGDKYICWSTSQVNILGDIKYNVGIDPTNLPVFEVVVKGDNIHIATGVHELSGTYVAEKGSSGGTIYDTDGDVVIEPPGGDNTKNTSAGDRLTVNGAFIGNRLDFYRTNGTLNANTSPVGSPIDQYDAEEFDYSPINWLQTGTSNNVLKINSITSLAPIY